MSNEVNVNEATIRMLAEAYYNMGYRKGSTAALGVIAVLAAPFIYRAYRDCFKKKAKEKN